MNNFPLKKYCSTKLMSDTEEDLTDLQKFYENFSGRIFGWSISRRINRSMDSCKWNYYENSTTLDGSTSWFKYDELIDDWLDLTVHEATKRGPALKNRLVGDAEMYKGLLNREYLRAGKTKRDDALTLDVRDAVQSRSQQGNKYNCYLNPSRKEGKTNAPHSPLPLSQIMNSQRCRKASTRVH